MARGRTPGSTGRCATASLSTAPDPEPAPQISPEPGPGPQPVPSPNQVYKGQWVDDTMHGRGKYIFPNGNTYEGQYEAGVRHGKGKFTYANGGVYTGGFANGKKNGFVSCTTPAPPLHLPGAPLDLTPLRLARCPTGCSSSWTARASR